MPVRVVGLDVEAEPHCAHVPKCNLEVEDSGHLVALGANETGLPGPGEVKLTSLVEIVIY